MRKLQYLDKFSVTDLGNSFFGVLYKGRHEAEDCKPTSAAPTS